MGLKKLLSIGLLFLAAPLFAGEDWQPLVIGPFGGQDNRDSYFSIPANQALQLINMEVTPGGRSIKSRPGYSNYGSLEIATATATGIYDFYDASGNDNMLGFNDRRIAVSQNGGSFSTIYSTVPTFGTYWDCADYLGYAYCANSGRDALFKTDGITASRLGGTVSSGTIVEACSSRLALAGMSGSKASEIDFSQDGDYTVWGTGALGSSPVQLTVASKGSSITHLRYLNGRLMWFKEYSFGFIIIGNQPSQTDWVVKTVSNDIGTRDNTSAVDPEGNLYFRGANNRIYKYDGSTVQDFSQDITGSIAASTSTTYSPAFATYFDSKLWFSVPGLSKSYVYNFNSSAWSIFTVKANGFAQTLNQMFLADPTFGQIDIYGSTNTDNGAHFSSVWGSKEYFFGTPFNAFDIANISISLNPSYDGINSNGGTINAIPGTTMTLYLEPDRATAKTYTISTYYKDYKNFTGTTGRITANRNIPVAPVDGANAHTVIIELSSNYPIQIYGIQLGVRPRPWTAE